MAGAQSGMLTPGELVWLVSAVAKGDDAAFDRLAGSHAGQTHET